MTNRLLIVDDEEPILFAMHEYFTAKGWTVDCARGLQEAESLAARFRYHLLVADVRLSAPGSTEGLEIAGAMRQRDPSIRVVLLTAYNSPEVEREARNRGIDLILCKPQPLPELERILCRLR